MKIQDIKPQEAEFYLESTKHTYKLRSINLEDEVWMLNTFGSREKIQEIFNECRFYEICRIIFNQMSIEDKAQFVAREVTIINEEGDKLLTKLGGPILFMQAVHGMEEKNSLVTAIYKTIGISYPDDEDTKKKARALQAKLSGMKYSMRFLRNTAGQQSTSSVEPQERSPGD